MISKELPISPELWQMIEDTAERDGVDVETVLKEAFRLYTESKPQKNVRPSVMAHFEDSLNRNRELYKLLAQ